MQEPVDLEAAAKEVLENNRRGDYTIPREGLYPHQWLWDSCFIAIGLRHYDIDRAQKEVLSLLRGQWHNGMLPNIILSKNRGRHGSIWHSWLSPLSPDHVSTSGITQPPMLAEAVQKIGAKLSKPERRSWYQKVYPALLAYHEWLYAERDPHGEGLTLQVHPWETGLDNTPPWMFELHQHELPFWVKLATKKPVEKVIDTVRPDLFYTGQDQRLSAYEFLAMYYVQRRLRRKLYDIDRMLSHSLFAIEDLTFNSILIRANHYLRSIAKDIGKKLPDELLESMRKTEAALETLWDETSGQYYSRNFVTHNLIPVPSIATFMPLYSGKITKERAAQLVKLLDEKKSFGPKYPVPSTPVNSDWFNPHHYWQGPTWVNTNWLIIDGLRQYGFIEEAEKLARKTLELVEKSGFYEYFSPLDGSPAGTNNFSWTAALAVDLLKNS